MKKILVLTFALALLSACGGNNVKQNSSASAQNGADGAAASDNFNAMLTKAKAGDAEAMTYVGVSLLKGKNPAQSIDWLAEASARGQGGASLVLATIYDTGKIVPQDCDKALKYYMLALQQGEKAAGCILGDKYAGIETLCKQNQDNFVAVVWYKKGLPEEDCKNALKNFTNIDTVKTRTEPLIVPAKGGYL